MLLAGDIGGTKTVLALFTVESGAHHPLVKKTFPSKHYESLEAVVNEFLTGVDYPISFAAFGVAGPVLNDEARVTNLPWHLKEQRLAEALKLQGVHLLNDLEAIATAVPILEAEDMVTLREGQPIPRGTIGVIAPGTGLGEAFLVWQNGRYHAYPSEGGHADFAPADDLQIELLTYLHGRYRHVSYERVCSGIGIPNLYTFFRDTERYPEPGWLREQLDESRDMTPVIVRAAQDQTADICVATLNLFIDILAREAGNLALKVLATGGVYVGGGITAHILPQLVESPFVETFTSKGRFSELLRDIPIHVIKNRQTALLGAAHDGLTMMLDSMQ